VDEARPSESGFTLLEVIVAITIISCLAAAFTPLITSSVRRIKWEGERIKTLHEMRSLMERAVASRDSTLKKTVTVSWGDASRDIEGLVIKRGNLITFVVPRN
jgi:prepilin-type N-terminal cleavage/methylation domain-containing protein